jgi:hypothetical protein
MYLDVVNPAPAVPAVRGLSGRRGMGAVRIRIPLMRSRGFGQTSVSAPVATQVQQWLASLQGSTLNAEDYAGSGCGSGGNDAPCASASDAANSVYPFVSMLCQENQNTAQLTGAATDPNCGDGGNALAAAQIAALMQIFNALPASTWTTETAALAAGPGSYECAPGMTLITSGPSAGSCGLTSVVGGQSGTGTPTVIPVPAAVNSGGPAAAVVQTSSPSPVAPSAPATVSSPAPLTSSGSAVTAAVPDWLTNDIAGFPVWGWGLGAIALLFVFGGKK